MTAKTGKPLSKRDEYNPRYDPHSLGGILISEYGVPHGELLKVLHVQADNPERLLGEICVRNKLISPSTLRQALRHQKRARRQKSPIPFIKHATECTKTLTASVGALAAASLQVAEKLK